MKTESAYIFFNRRDRVLDVCLSYRDHKENGHYIVECPQLRLTDQGKTRSEAYRNLAGNILTTLVVAIETGNIRAHLKALGFKETKVPIPDAKVFEIPLSDDPDLIPLTLRTSLPADVKSSQCQFQICV